ncbi:ABC transporter permease [Streptomyces sp. NPDC052052]|uniref:ABC transporter permease n=1 Tax=Streptomyces sp. NPDC052052 TaxID=3154756 RepID=UPI0034444817
MTGSARPVVHWLVRRIALSALVLLGSATTAFLALRLTPGDPVRVILGGSPATPEVVAQVRRELGTDRPLSEQYFLFLGKLLRGDLGTSYQLRDSVSHVIGSQLWQTAELALSSFVLAFVLALLLAVSTAGRWPVLRGISTQVELVLSSSPGFWVGVLLLTLFSFRWHVFPAAGGDGPSALVLPAVTLAASMVGVFAQVMRAGVERALEEPFVLSARARGSGDTAVRFRHALRHALVPMVTLSGWVMGTLFSGAVVVETVFSRQGLGRLLATAIQSRDFPVVTGVVVVSTLVFVVVNLLVDWLYRVIDPRLREVPS